MTTEEKKRRYLELCHAMQSGVAMMENYNPLPTTGKHLRVGVNAAMSDFGGLITLLIKKGVITDDEVLDAIIESMEREVKKYEEEIHRATGSDKITLG